MVGANAVSISRKEGGELAAELQLQVAGLSSAKTGYFRPQRNRKRPIGQTAGVIQQIRRLSKVARAHQEL